ncbi:MAG: TonB-dependent receptor [Sphingomonas sp.]
MNQPLFAVLTCALVTTTALVTTPAVAREAAPVPAASSPAAAPSEDPDQRADIVVTGILQSYDVGETSSATRTPTKLRDVPQSVSSISRAQIDDQGLRSIADLLRAVPGATNSQGEGHRDQIVLRGNASTADFFVDGLRDDVQYYRPLYNLERVDVLRGPNALTFGRGGGGGVINRVTKQAELGNFGAASLSGNSFGAWYVDGDANAKLSEGAAFRLNAVHEELANHRDRFGGRVTALNPTLTLADGSHTRFTLGYEFDDDRRVVDRGIPSENGAPLLGFRDTFFGVDGVNRAGFQAHVVRASVEHEVTSSLRVNSRLLYGDYDKFYRNIFTATPVTGLAGARIVGAEGYFDTTTRQNFISQTDLVWRGTTGPVEHTVLGGVDFTRQTTANDRLNAFFDTATNTVNNRLRVFVPLTDPFVVPAITFRPGTGQRDNRTVARVIAGYAQDQLKFGPVELLVGARFDHVTVDAVDRLTAQALSRTDNLVSPRAGLVVHPIAPVSLYFSYARSFLPQSGDQFTSLSITSAALRPEKFDNLEIGAKWEPRPGLLLAISAYQLDRSNTRSPSAVAGVIVQTGRQRSRGIELEGRGEVLPGWQLSFAYALQEARIAETTAAAPAGRAVGLVPRHALSTFSRVALTKWLGAGLGVTYQSEKFTSISNAVRLPAFTRLDAALFARLTDRIDAQVNIENITNTRYFPDAGNDSNISTGAPINARATIRVRL